MFRRLVPDGIVCIIAYHILLSVVSLFCGVVMFTISLPSSLAMGSFFMIGSVAIGLTAGFTVVLGISLLYSVWGLWHFVPAGRISAMIISVIMILCAIPMIFWFLIDNDAIFSMMMGLGGATILIASGGTLHYLTRPQIKKHLFYSKHKDSYVNDTQKRY